MLGLKNLFTKNTETPSAKDVQLSQLNTALQSSNTRPAGRGPIGYDPNLVTKLKDDHQGLLTHFTSMMKAAEKGNDKHLIGHLIRFKKLLQNHLITENTKLYLYLNSAYRKDPDTFALVRSFKKEMGDIGKVVNAFVAKWEKANFDSVSRGIFLKEAEKIAPVLVQRINTEEERLYEIYDFSASMDN